ncbi:MAG: flippase, partial [candidate division Zixibacteria bacterium]|nr:flippase [candidate division Zixibacteria bacterium]
VGLLSKWIVFSVLNIPEGLRSEALEAFYLLACSIPVVITTAGLRGILEAYQRFGLINAARTVMGVFTFGGPLLILPFTQSLFAVVAILVVGRVIVWIIYLLICLSVVPNLRHEIIIDREEIGPLLSFGSWMTVTNLISPLMVQMDRFLIGALISVTAVTYYSTPFEVVNRIRVIPVAAIGVLFPAIATSQASDRNRTAMLFGRGVKFVQLALFPIILVVVGFAGEGLRLWLGDEFVVNSTLVLQVLAVGVMINSVAQVSFALVQGFGRPDLTAKLHLIELPLYLTILWLLVRNYGITGAAFAWTARVTLDMIMLCEIGKRILPESLKAVNRLRLELFVSVTLIVGCLLIPSLALRIIYVLIVLVLFVPAGWRLILSEDDRKAIRARYLVGRRR